MNSEGNKEMPAPFWYAKQTENRPEHFSYIAPPEACVGPADHQFFMGGAAMAMAIEGLERWSGKPLLWTTIQFLNHGMLDDEIELSIQQTGGGRNIVQASAAIRSGGKTLQHAVAALGKRDGEADKQFAAMPDVPPPSDCPIKADDTFGQPNNLIDQFERRTALEDSERGIEYMWIKPKFPTNISADLLAITSDFFLGAHKRSRGGTSLDNTLRICSLAETEWILSATYFSSFFNGAAQGTQQQFTEDGKLLSLSSQTGLLPRVPNP